MGVSLSGSRSSLLSRKFVKATAGSSLPQKAACSRTRAMKSCMRIRKGTRDKRDGLSNCDSVPHGDGPVIPGLRSYFRPPECERHQSGLEAAHCRCCGAQLPRRERGGAPVFSDYPRTVLGTARIGDRSQTSRRCVGEPFCAAIPFVERERVMSSLMVGPSSAPTKCGNLSSFRAARSCDSALWLLRARNQRTPTESFLHRSARALSSYRTRQTPTDICP